MCTKYWHVYIYNANCVLSQRKEGLYVTHWVGCCAQIVLAPACHQGLRLCFLFICNCWVLSVFCLQFFLLRNQMFVKRFLFSRDMVRTKVRLQYVRKNITYTLDFDDLIEWSLFILVPFCTVNLPYRKCFNEICLINSISFWEYYISVYDWTLINMSYFNGLQDFWRKTEETTHIEQPDPMFLSLYFCLVAMYILHSMNVWIWYMLIMIIIQAHYICELKAKNMCSQ